MFQKLYDPTCIDNVTPYTVVCVLCLIWAVFPRSEYKSTLPLRLMSTGLISGFYGFIWLFDDLSPWLWAPTFFSAPLTLVAGLVLALCMEKVRWRYVVFGVYLPLVVLYAYGQLDGWFFFMS